MPTLPPLLNAYAVFDFWRPLINKGQHCPSNNLSQMTAIWCCMRRRCPWHSLVRAALFCCFRSRNNVRRRVRMQRRAAQDFSTAKEKRWVESNHWCCLSSATTGQLVFSFHACFRLFVIYSAPYTTHSVCLLAEYTAKRKLPLRYSRRRAAQSKRYSWENVDLTISANSFAILFKYFVLKLSVSDSWLQNSTIALNVDKRRNVT